ncbi:MULTISPECIES: hypothetical protein [unclassified Escherichia]|nr:MULTISPECIES: hypothetical protein [unclassified Escherichia]
MLTVSGVLLSSPCTPRTN